MTFDPSIGDGAQLMDIMQMQAALAGYHLTDPQNDCEVTPADAGGLAVDVSGGSARLSGSAESVGPWSDVALPNADPDVPRKALVYLDAAGVVQTLGGIPTSGQPDGEVREKTYNPQVPVPVEEFLPLAEVWIAADTETVTDSDIQSRRMPFSFPHGNESHTDDIALNGESQPPEDHDNESHQSEYITSSEAPVQSVDGRSGDVISDGAFRINDKITDIGDDERTVVESYQISSSVMPIITISVNALGDQDPRRTFVDIYYNDGSTHTVDVSSTDGLEAATIWPEDHPDGLGSGIESLDFGHDNDNFADADHAWSAIIE